MRSKALPEGRSVAFDARDGVGRIASRGHQDYKRSESDKEKKPQITQITQISISDLGIRISDFVLR